MLINYTEERVMLNYIIMFMGYLVGPRSLRPTKKYNNITSTFFENTLSAVRVDGELSDCFEVLAGTGQGDS